MMSRWSLTAGCHLRDRSSAADWPTGSNPLLTPSQDAAGSSHLQHLAVLLNYVEPTMLRLPKQYSLSFLFSSMTHGESAVCQSVRGHIKLFMISCQHEMLLEITGLPDILLQDPPLKQVGTTLSLVGVDFSPLLPELALVPHLRPAITKSICVLLLQNTTWKHSVLFQCKRCSCNLQGPSFSRRLSQEQISCMDLYRDMPY